MKLVVEIAAGICIGILLAIALLKYPSWAKQQMDLPPELQDQVQQIHELNQRILAVSGGKLK